MGKLEIEERIRYPPFESYRFKPNLLPIASSKTIIKKGIKKSQINGILEQHPAPFIVGTEDSWLVQMRYLYNGKPIDVNANYSHPQSKIIPPNSLIDKQRIGWYLIPNKNHKTARQILNFAVSVLLITLAYLFVEPLLSYLGIPSIGTGRVRFGLLDYPALAVLVVPILFVPIVMRVLANFSDLVSQRNFLTSQPTNPEIIFHSNTKVSENLEVEVNFPDKKDSWKNMKILWRVGVLPPSRNSVIEALGRNSQGQPPPGFTTELPHHWTVDLDDGTGGGEDSPMQTTGVKGGLFLKPMRMMVQSKVLDYEGGKISIPPPSDDWPGSYFSDFIRIHWELIIIIERENKSELMWVQPLKVSQMPVSTKTTAIINSGRTETNHPLSTD